MDANCPPSELHTLVAVQRHDVFDQAEAYERYVGRWSRQLAPGFIRWLGVRANSTWLDVGCGTGSLSEAILATAHPHSVIGIDPSSPFVAHASESIRNDRATFRVGNAMSLEFPAGSFDAVAAALVLNFVPDPSTAVLEMRRVTKSGGRVGAYVWDYADGMRMMRVFWDAAAKLDPAAAQLDEGYRFPITRPDALRACFLGGGLDEVEVTPLDVDMTFAGFDDYWQPFLGGQAPAPAYAMSLAPERREQLASAIRSRIEREPGGPIRMVSRAWAVRGTVP
jgi:SAM-dependent methyltransferase